MLAVKNDPCTIKYIKNPTIKVCLTAVREKGDVIKYIENPSDEIWAEALMSNFDLINSANINKDAIIEILLRKLRKFENKDI